jgi:hypothetical protein
MKVKKPIKVVFLALISTISVSAFAGSNGTLVFVNNSSPLAMNVQVPTTEIAVPIVAPGRTSARYGFYPLSVDRPFNVWDNRPNNGGFGRCFAVIPKNTAAVIVKISEEKMLHNGKRWIDCSVQVIK